MHYRWVIYEWRNGLQIDLRWIEDGFAFRSQDRLQINLIMGHGLRYKWMIDKSHVGQTLVHMSLRWITGWVIDGSHKCVSWVTNGSRMSTDESLIGCTSNTFLIFSKLTHLWPSHNLATLRIREINIIFHQSEESNPVVSLTTLLWCVTSFFVYVMTHCLEMHIIFTAH